MEQEHHSNVTYSCMMKMVNLIISVLVTWSQTQSGWQGGDQSWLRLNGLAGRFQPEWFWNSAAQLTEVPLHTLFSETEIHWFLAPPRKLGKGLGVFSKYLENSSVQNSIEYFVLMRANPGHQKMQHAGTSIWYLLMAVRGVSSLGYFVVEALMRNWRWRFS